MDTIMMIPFCHLIFKANEGHMIQFACQGAIQLAPTGVMFSEIADHIAKLRWPLVLPGDAT